VDSDADRLAMIQGLGGLRVSVRGSKFWAIFDNAYADIQQAEGTSPALTCRSSDVEFLTITKDDVIEDIGDDEWRVRRLEADGTGMTVIRLRR
jgi:hypothetical protein